MLKLKGLFFLFIMSAHFEGVAQLRDRTDPDFDFCKTISGDLLERFSAEANIPGLAVSVDVKSKIIWDEAIGMADLESGTPVDTLTKFRIASISKLLTGTVLGKIADEGRLSLSDPIGQLLDSIPEAWKSITPQQLAEHSSGIPHYADVEDALDVAEYVDTRSGLNKFKNRELQHEPGKGKTYSSYAYTVIAALIENAVGQPFTEFMQAYLFEPLGMKNTLPDRQREIIPKRTGFYQFGPSGEIQNAPYINLSGRWAGSGFLSTAGDLARFGAQHYVSSTFLTPQALKRITTIRELENVNLNEGLAWGPRIGYEGRNMIFGDGSTPGATGGLLVFPEQEVCVALLSNVRGAPIDRGELQSIVQPFVLASEGKEVVRIPADFTGDYELKFLIGGQELVGILTVEQSMPLRGSLEFTGLQSFDLAGGFMSANQIWLFGVSDGRGPISLGILPVRLDMDNDFQSFTGMSFRIDASIKGERKK